METGEITMQSGTATQKAQKFGGQNTEKQPVPGLHERIALRAYKIYEESGYVEGRDLENWFQAEQAVLSDDLG
jgi:hypothetical protein